MPKQRSYSDIALLVGCANIPRLPHDQMMEQSLAICDAVDARRIGQPKEKIYSKQLTESEVDELVAMHRAGMTPYQIAMATGRKRNTVAGAILRAKKREAANV